MTDLKEAFENYLYRNASVQFIKSLYEFSGDLNEYTVGLKIQTDGRYRDKVMDGIQARNHQRAKAKAYDLITDAGEDVTVVDAWIEKREINVR
jgi:hypothetical protein